MDLPSKDMYDTFKDDIWKELGLLDPDWFNLLTAQATANDGNVSDQDDLSSNQEGNFKTPFDKTAVDSQLFLTPKLFRHCRVLSPETEQEKPFAAEQGKETLPWPATQSPHLFQMSKEGVQGVKYGGSQHQSQGSFNLLHTPQKSPVSYAKHISESLGADIHPDISWTSSLNTPPPLASTLILTKPDESPCPVSVPADKNVVFVRKLFPSLSNASRVGVVSPKDDHMTTIHQGAFSHGAGQNPESFNSPPSSLNRSDCVWRQKLPDAIEDGEIHSTVTSVLDGADDVLSILFNNSSSALRKVKTDKIKRKQIFPKRECGCNSVDIPTSTAASSEQQMADQKTDGLPSPTPLKAGDTGITQWSPLSLSEIQLCTVDTSGCNSSTSQEENNSITPEHLRRDIDCGQLGRPHVKVTQCGLTKKKRKFVYTVETTKLHVQGEEIEFQKMESLPGIPDSGQDVNLTQLMRAPEEVDCCNIRSTDMKKQDYLAEGNLHPSVQAKVQDLDISQLSRDFAQDFSQMPNPGQVSNIEKDTPQNGFSPSACLSAMKQANQKARQANLCRDCVSNSRSVLTADLINEGTVNDSGFQSAVAGATSVTASSFVLPSSENNGHIQQWLDFKSDIHGTTYFSSLNNGNGKVHLDGNLQESAGHPTAIKESQTLSHAKETTLLPSSAKVTVDNINYIPLDRQVHSSVQEKTVSLPSVLASGFQTASHKSIQISSDNLERAKHLFEEPEGEISLSNQLVQCTHDTEDKLGFGHGSVTNNNINSFHLTASQKADVTELCALLEEADSQFEFTQFKTAELKQHCEDDAALPRKVDKELDPDFFTGIDFDDSFNSDAEKHLALTMMHDQVTVVSSETSNTTSESTSLSLLNAVKKEKSSTEDTPKHILESKSSMMSAESQNLDRDDHTETSKLENKNSLMLGVGFKTAGGNVLRVSKKCLSKARALFADLEENLVKTEKSPTKQSSETDPKMQQKCSVDNHIGDLLHFKEKKGKLISLDRQQSDNEDGTESLKNIKMNTSKCQSGFQMASGKEISISAKAMQEAGAFFKDCDTIDAKASTSITQKESIETLSGSVSHKASLQKCKNAQGMRVKFSEDAINEFENKTRPAVRSTEAAKEINSFAFKNTVALRNTSFGGNSSKCVDPSGIELSSVGEFCTANGAKELVMTDPLKNAGMHTFEDTNKHLPNQILISPSENGGFQTASGKGVTISSAALRKAKSLLSDYNEVEDIICVKQKHSEMPVPGPVHRNLGFLAASGKTVAFSSEALQKAKALFSDIGFSAEIPAVSHTRDDKKRDDVENVEKTHCAFSTAGGAKADVLQSNMLKAKSLSEEFDYGSFSSKEMQEVDSCLKDCDFIDGEDGRSAKQRKCSIPGRGRDREKTHATKCKEEPRVNSTNADSLNGTFNGSLIEKSSLLCTSKNIDCSSINELSNDAECHTASRKRVSVWSDAMKSAKSLLREHDIFKATNKHIDTLPPQNCGFHTASGKGVAISSAALKKAKKLLSECEGIEDKISVQATPFKTPVPGPLHRNHGFLAASGKTVAFSSEALQKAKALFSDISFNAEIQAFSDTRNSKHDIALCDSEKSHCGFKTAGGAKVHVSQKNLLKAKNLFRDCTDGERCDSSSNPRSPHDTHERCKAKDAKRTCNSNLTTASDKDMPSKGNAPQVVKSLTSLYVTDHENENSSECALKKKRFKGGKNAPPGVSHLHDNPGEEMSSVLEYEINQTSGSEVSKVKKTEDSSVVCFQSLNLKGCTENQQKFLAQEALDCTKALLEDENLAGHRISVTLENTLLHDNPKSIDRSTEGQKGKGKRLIEDQHMTSQPPPKKRLLEEFERTVDGPRGSTLHPEKSSPNGSIKDRRVFKYNSSLHPNVTGPQSHSYMKRKNYVEARIQTATLMKSLMAENNKAANSKMATFIPPFFKNTEMEGGKSTVLKDNIRTPSTFVPPFKKEGSFVQESFSKPHDEDNLHHLFVMPCNSNTVPPTEKTQCATVVSGNESKKDIQTLALADTTINKLMNNSDNNNEKLPVGCGSEDCTSEAPFVESRRKDKFLNVHNVELARDMQDMRIRKKKRQTIWPLPGSLFLTKTSGVSRIPLKAAVNGKPPTKYTQKQLYSHGVHQHVYDITSETAESFRFNLQQFIIQEAFIDRGGVQLADGGWLIPSSDGMAGKEEFYRSLCDTPGVDPKLITKEWVYNHFRWIVWKQASMERSFPEIMGSLCLTPEQVLLQLKYRYDVEVDHSWRPALRKIMEKDDTAAKTLVLCVCGVVSWGHSPRRHSLSDIKTPGVDAKVENPSAVVWLTDGWYAIKAQLDEPLTAMLHKDRLVVGGKLIVHGAQLVGSQDACSPLEAPESLMLKICANSSRPTRWDAKLGFHRDPRPFLLPISSLYSNGGPVGSVDVIILRSYPVQWMERKPDGGTVFRSVRAEEKEARRYNIHKQKAMEIVYARIQAEFEKEENGNKPQCRRRTMSRQEIASLLDGEELYEAVGDDPAYLEAQLSEQQMEALHNHRRSLMEKKQADLQDRYRRALENAEDGEGSCPKRDVTPVWRLCVADSMDNPGSVYQMNLWRPPSDLQSLLKEGCRYKVYNLTTSDAKKHGGSTTVQLTGTKKTQFEEIQASQEWLSTRFQPRVSTHFVDLQNPEFQPLCGEVDLTGYIISIIDGQGFSPAFYLADGHLNFIKVRCFSSLAQSGLEDVVKPRMLVALSNVQLRGQSTTPTPVVYAGDLTVFSTNPKEVHLQESLSQLRNLVQVQENLFLTAEEKLTHLIKPDCLSSISSPALQTRTPASTMDRTPKNVKSQQPVRSLGSSTPVSRNPHATNCSTEKDLSSLKRKRALNYLSRIPSPPPLSLLNSVASPCVNKTFVPPRRSVTPNTLKTIQTPTHRLANSPVEDEWVNDEELAMIDTQALLIGDSVVVHDTVL